MDRIERLRTHMEENSLDAFLVTSKENRSYFSGFQGSAGYLWITANESLLATDFRYTEQAKDQAPGYQVIRIEGSSEWLKTIMSDAQIHRIGFESSDMTVSLHTHILALIKAIDRNPSLIPITSMLEHIRSIKDPEELELLGVAIKIADQAMEYVGARLRPGQTEKSVAWELERYMRELGADSLSFSTIVAAGPNGAKPHHHPTERLLVEGEGVVIDMGAAYEGYCSDITRTFMLGKPNDKFRQIYDIVLAAQETAEATARSGMTGSEIDSLARKIITDAGYGDSFGHSLGHGIGIAVHEYPQVGPNATGIIENGMVFSVEPGIYLEGWGGVRIEDLVVMEENGPRTLTAAHKQDIIDI
jgi:Xaa-Pro aminopeptidase